MKIENFERARELVRQIKFIDGRAEKAFDAETRDDQAGNGEKRSNMLYLNSVFFHGFGETERLLPESVIQTVTALVKQGMVARRAELSNELNQL